MKYYVDLESDQVAAQVWSALGLELRTARSEAMAKGDQEGDLPLSVAPDMREDVCGKLFSGQDL